MLLIFLVCITDAPSYINLVSIQNSEIKNVISDGRMRFKFSTYMCIGFKVAIVLMYSLCDSEILRLGDVADNILHCPPRLQTDIS